jgi:hypothetical protein
MTSILHNHLRAYKQARLQKLADGQGNEAARARMRIANLNLEADAARRVWHDSDITLVGGVDSKPAELHDDSDTEGEEDSPREKDKGMKQAVVEVKASKGGAVVAQKQTVPGKKEKKGMKEKTSKVTFAGYVPMPKPKGPQMAFNFTCS